MPPAPRFSPGLAVVVTVVILVIVNVVDVRVPHASLVAGPVCAAVLLGIARLAGLSWAELGLGPGTWRRGATWAAAVIGIVALVLAVGAALPLTRAAFRDSRYHLGWAGALLTAFVLIPVGTVLLEEVAFRGVLWGLLRRRRRDRRWRPWCHRRCSDCGTSSRRWDLPRTTRRSGARSARAGRRR